MGTVASRTAPLASRMRFLRTVWLALLAAVVVYAAVPEISGTTPKLENPTFVKIIAALALACVLVCFRFRRRFIASGAHILATDQNNIAALRRWQTGYILHFSCSLSVALYGLVLRYTGSSFSQVVPFYVAGFVLMLYGMPKQPN